MFYGAKMWSDFSITISFPNQKKGFMPSLEKEGLWQYQAPVYHWSKYIPLDKKMKD
jgi:hypothetical protein